MAIYRTVKATCFIFLPFLHLEFTGREAEAKSCSHECGKNGHRALADSRSTHFAANYFKNFKTFVRFILEVCVPTWFKILTRPKCKEGAKHHWFLVSRCRPLFLQLSIRMDIMDTLRIFYWQCFLRKRTRHFAVSRVMNARRQSAGTTAKVRKFENPPLYFDAAAYTDLVSWSSKKILVTESPLVR